MEAQLAAAREIIDRLEDRLTDALIRLGNVENTTRTLEKRSVVSHFPDLLGPPIAAAARPPTLTVYPATHTGNLGLLETYSLESFFITIIQRSVNCRVSGMGNMTHISGTHFEVAARGAGRLR